MTTTMTNANYNNNNNKKKTTATLPPPQRPQYCARNQNTSTRTPTTSKIAIQWNNTLRRKTYQQPQQNTTNDTHGNANNDTTTPPDDCCYWNDTIIDLFRPLHDEDRQETKIPSFVVVDDDNRNSNNDDDDEGEEGEGEEEEEYDDEDEIISISSTTLFLLAAGVIDQLQHEFTTTRTTRPPASQSPSSRPTTSSPATNAIIMAVAIPEGPLLPLAVLVVHALNGMGFVSPTTQPKEDQQQRPPDDDNDESSYYAILLPFDPKEGTARLWHILQDARPTYILGVPGGKDREVFHDLLQDYHHWTTTQPPPSPQSPQPHHPVTTPTLLNFVTLVTRARRNLAVLQQQNTDVRPTAGPRNNDGNSSSCSSSRETQSVLQFLVQELQTTIMAEAATTPWSRPGTVACRSRSRSKLQRILAKVTDSFSFYLNSITPTTNDETNTTATTTTKLSLLTVSDPSEDHERSSMHPDPQQEEEEDADAGSPSAASSSTRQQYYEHTPPPQSTTTVGTPRISHIVYTSGTTGVSKGCVSSTAALVAYMQAKNAAHDIFPASHHPATMASPRSSTTVLLASSLSFDPCVSDILATLDTLGAASLVLVSPSTLLTNLTTILHPQTRPRITHVLCTPTLWSLTLLQNTTNNINVNTNTNTNTNTNNNNNRGATIGKKRALRDNFPHLQRIALGGEPIPKSIINSWARVRSSATCNRNTVENSGSSNDVDGEEESISSCRLLATYGVTEACVYQTCGEIFREDDMILHPRSSTTPTLAAADEEEETKQHEHELQSRTPSPSISTVPVPVRRGQTVGYPLRGTQIRICNEQIQDRLSDVAEIGMQGEIVLFGNQVDKYTGYLHREDLCHKFVTEEDEEDKSQNNNNNNDDDDGSVDGNTNLTKHYYYRTGDRGYICPTNQSLIIMGRIVGEEGMIKINGIRVELGEIEAALLADDECEDEVPVVLDCLAQVVKNDESNYQSIYAYCVLNETIWKEIGFPSDCIHTTTTANGVIINDGPLWTLLRKQCSNRLRNACIPKVFVGIRKLPLSRTGKKDRSGLPKLESCDVLNNNFGNSSVSISLKDYGLAGRIVTQILVQYLNLQPCQQQMVTKAASFVMLGGDSLSATIVCRTLYARFNEIENSRWIGGGFGELPKPFDAATLLRARNLGEYVDTLDNSGLRKPSVIAITDDLPASKTFTNKDSENSFTSANDDDNNNSDLLYDALLQASMLGQCTISAGLLSLGANPNFDSHRGRIGKTSGRIEQRAIFKANPLHLACLQGCPILVRLLLDHNANYRSPNTNGLFPIHLAAGGGVETEEEDARRLECVKLLLNSGCPLLMKDANKQTVLHAASRAGHISIIHYVINTFQSISDTKHNLTYRGAIDGPIPPSHFINFYDRWFRTAVHWAILNGRLKALRTLLDYGCDPTLGKRKANKYTSLVTETPAILCKRVHGNTDIGNEMEDLLCKAIELHGVLKKEIIPVL